MNNFRKGATWIWIIVIVGLVIIGVGTYYFLNNSSSGYVDIVANQLSYLKKNDIASAYALNADAFKKYTTQDSFKQTIDKYDIFKNNTKYFIDENVTNKNKACIKISLINSSNKYLVVFYALTKQNNKWEISTINFGPVAETSCNLKMIGL